MSNRVGAHAFGRRFSADVASYGAVWMSKLEPSETDLVKECGGLREVQKRETRWSSGEVEELESRAGLAGAWHRPG